MSNTVETEGNPFHDECMKIANKKAGNLSKMIEQRESSKKMCRIGIFLSPLLVGIPLAWVECKRNALVKQKLGRANLEWNKTYQKCIRRKELESQYQ